MSKKKKKYAKYKKQVPDNISIRPVNIGGETRYYIFNADTGEIFDDNQKYGYKTEQSARDFFVRKSTGQTQACNKQSVKKLVSKWCNKNSAVVLNLKDSMFFWDEVTEQNIAEFLEDNGIAIETLPFSVKDLKKYMSSL